MRVIVILALVAIAHCAADRYDVSQTREVNPRDLERLRSNVQTIRKRAAEEYEEAKRLESALDREVEIARLASHERGGYHPGIVEKTKDMFSNLIGGERASKYMPSSSKYIPTSASDLYETAKDAGQYMKDKAEDVMHTVRIPGVTSGYGYGGRHVETTNTWWNAFKNFLWGVAGSVAGFVPLMFAVRLFMDWRARSLHDSQTNAAGISSHVNPMIRYTVAPMKEDMFIKQWNSMVNYMRRQPGFNHVKLCKGVPPSNEYLACCEFNNIDQYRQAVNTREFQDMKSRMSSIATTTPHLFYPVTDLSSESSRVQ